jgi:hypothetical protein
MYTNTARSLSLSLEAIRKKTIALEKENWYIEYTWINPLNAELSPICHLLALLVAHPILHVSRIRVKAHAGHERNELADKLAKEVTRESEICYSKFPRSEIEHQEGEISFNKWQQLYNSTKKGRANKEFFLKIKDRLKMKITLTPNFTTMVTARVKTRSYLHLFKVIESPVCPCANGNQTVEHIIYDCGKLNNERRKLIADISKGDHWPVGKNVLVNKYLKQVTHFINSIDYGNM